MIKVTVMYRATEGVRFDHEYYCSKHMPMVQEKLGSACVRYEIDRGLSGGAPGVGPLYVAMCHIYSDSLEAFQAAMAKNGAQIMADVPNYTDLAPQMQISQLVA